MEFKSSEYWKSQEGFPFLGRKLRIASFIPNEGGISIPYALSCVGGINQN